MAQPAPAFVSLDEYLDGGGVKLAGGALADPDDWKAVAISRTTDLSCTAALVGRQVVLTSAHCLDASPGAATAKLAPNATARFAGQDFKLLECEMHPDYAAAAPNGNFPRSGRDYALCKTEFPVPVTPFESLANHALQTGPVVLMGFGCYELKAVNGRLETKIDPENARKLRLGDQVIEAAARGLGSSGETLSRTVSRGPKEPNVCPGDSGGPVFTGIKGKAPKKGRLISGLNSAFHGDWGVNADPVVFHSYLAPTGSAFWGWATKWADDRKLAICGIQRPAGLDGCRS